MENQIRKIVVENAVLHEGKANTNSVLGKIIADNPKIKEKINEIIPIINKIVKEINSLNLYEQKSMALKLKIKEKPKNKPEKFKLPQLPNIKIGKVVTSFPPEPSKYPHIGHLKGALLNFEYAKKYGGKFILRFEDSNPQLVKQEYYDAIIDGFKWIGLQWHEIDYLTNHMEEYYKAIKTLIENKDAYICSCPQEKIKKNRFEGINCSCREKDSKDNMKDWKEMLTVSEKGSKILRMKIDMNHNNTVMRDPTIARIIDTSHIRTKSKYRVWPSYDLGTSLLDSWENVTHRIRTKEFELRKELQEYILNKLGLTSPFILEVGRLNIKNAIIQGRDIREGIKSKKFSGWDDPQLTTLVSLKRRGFVPEALKEFILSTGVTKSESVYDWELLESFNRKIIDSISDRYFAVLDPVKIKILDLPKENISIKMKPGSEIERNIPIISDEVYISKIDNESLINKKAGLMFLCTSSFGEVKRFVSKNINQDIQKIHWVGSKNIKIKIMMPNGKIQEGLAEPAVLNLKKGQLIQFYRVGFCKVDSIGKEILFYFTHK